MYIAERKSFYIYNCVQLVLDTNDTKSNLFELLLEKADVISEDKRIDLPILKIPEEYVMNTKKRNNRPIILYCSLKDKEYERYSGWKQNYFEIHNLIKIGIVHTPSEYENVVLGISDFLKLKQIKIEPYVYQRVRYEEQNVIEVYIKEVVNNVKI